MEEARREAAKPARGPKCGQGDRPFRRHGPVVPGLSDCRQIDRREDGGAGAGGDGMRFLGFEAGHGGWRAVADGDKDFVRGQGHAAAGGFHEGFLGGPEVEEAVHRACGDPVAFRRQEKFRRDLGGGKGEIGCCLGKREETGSAAPAGLGRSWGEEIGAAVAQGRELSAPGSGGFGGDGGAEEGGGRTRFGDDFTVGIDNGAGSSVVEMGVGTAPVETEHEGLVLDGPGAEQDGFMLLAAVGPVGDDAEEVGPGGGGGAEEFREAEVIADDGGDRESVPREGDDFRARSEGLGFASRGEGVDFPVAGEEGAVGGEGEGFIGSGPVRKLPGQATQDIDPMLAGETGEEVFRLGGGSVGGLRHVHAEATGEHFGHYEE